MTKTDFTSAVQAVVKAIPPGTTMSYRAVAVAAGYPKAARAVANVMATNYAPDIPCHRVIRSNGTLGGYNRGGEAVKRAILQSESNKI